MHARGAWNRSEPRSDAGQRLAVGDRTLESILTQPSCARRLLRQSKSREPADHRLVLDAVHTPDPGLELGVLEIIAPQAGPATRTAEMVACTLPSGFAAAQRPRTRGFKQADELRSVSESIDRTCQVRLRNGLPMIARAERRHPRCRARWAARRCDSISSEQPVKQSNAASHMVSACTALVRRGQLAAGGLRRSSASRSGARAPRAR